MFFALVAVTLAILSHAQAHGDHGHEYHQQEPLSPDADWATRHMAEEHLINAFDAGSFFSLHDYDSTGEWTPEDILKTYGLRHESTDHISEDQKDKAVRAVLELYDRDHSGTISFSEFVDGDGMGIKLPDFGYGPGHHGDDEFEYEIHHFEKFHGPDTTLEDLTHPEDIEHFRKHEMMEEQEERQQKMDAMPIVEANIPSKFRRHV